MLKKPSHFMVIAVFTTLFVYWLKTKIPQCAAISNKTRFVRVNDDIQDASPTPEKRTILMKVTAYCLCRKCCGKWALIPREKRKTAAGDNPFIFDGVAAAPKLLPYRTKLRIPGVGVKEVDDTGGAMRKSAKGGVYHVDIRMESHKQALEWGVKWLNVELQTQQGETR